ncbi:MAG: NAD-dependent epimerase/dehydratase family protein [Cyanobacteriota bacterium]|nr:NAD-dependent epimerase/dehydratase family protein [Cyanobacteriota bacterium]
MIGGCGFIGSHIVDHLRDLGCVIRIIDRNKERFRDPFPDVQYVLGDYAEKNLLGDALDGIDVVIHLASSTVPQTSNLDPAKDVGDNLLGSIALLDGMVKYKVPKIIYLSSGGTIYGIPQVKCVDEGQPLEPIVSYGIVKLAIEKYIHLYSRLHGLDYCILRASNPYGPRQGRLGVQGVIGTFLHKLSTGSAVEIWGDGTIVRDFLYVSDLARACALAIEGGSKSIYNVGSSEGYSINQVIAVMSKVTGLSIVPRYKHSMPYDVPFVTLDTSKIRQDLGWIPEVDLESGIAESWAWIKGQQAKEGDAALLDNIR